MLKEENNMKGYAMLKIGESGWIEKDRPVCGPMDAICKPLALVLNANLFTNNLFKLIKIN